uniref:U32-Liphistoxin-Lsp1a_1 n=1 Tax=Liphistius sp. SGP-2016 TaxID=1905180 RepID=A0A4Q8K2W0_9ARAC
MARTACLFSWLLVAGVWTSVRCQGHGLVVANASSVRQQRLQELLNTLGTYSMNDSDLQSFTLAKSRPETTSPKPSMPDQQTQTGRNDLPSSKRKSHEEFYKIFYSTPEGVKYLKKQYGPTGLQEARAAFGVTQELEDLRLANEHFLRILTRARCRVPAPRIVRVKDYYPDPSREYLPRCTILHRCGEGSGCCDNDAFQCVASEMQEVALHFYTLTVGKQRVSSGMANSVDRLLFVNHTACHCQPINYLPRMQTPEVHHPLVGGQRGSSSHHSLSKCHECPVPFTQRIYSDGRCGCDCFDRQKPCLRIKRGREPLPDIERRCVEANYCHVPDCEHGVFETSTGYCPRRHDEGSRLSMHRQHLSTHRWSFIERD